MSRDTFNPPVRYRDGNDHKVYGRVTEIVGGVATIRVEAQRGKRRDGVWEDIPASFVAGKACRRLDESGEGELAIGDEVAVLVPLEPTKRVCTVIHRRERR